MEIVDLPSYKMVIFQFAMIVSLPEGETSSHYPAFGRSTMTMETRNSN